MLKTSPDGRAGLAGLEKTLTGSEPDDSVVPAPVRRAVKFMLGGGALTLVTGVFLVIYTIIDASAFKNSKGQQITSGQLAGGVAEIIVEFLVYAALWVLMARFNRGGRVWARIVASVLCVLDTINTYSLVNSLTTGQTVTVADVVYIVLAIATWILGVLAIALVWRGESSEYFRSRSARS
jgi:hypothetical protein